MNLAAPQRRLAAATLVGAIGFGAFASGSAVFFTRAVGLTPSEVGLGLAVAGAVGIAGALVAGEIAGRYGARETLAVLSAAQAGLFAAYCWVDGFPAFLFVVCTLAFAEGGAGVARVAGGGAGVARNADPASVDERFLAEVADKVESALLATVAAPERTPADLAAGSPAGSRR